MENRPTVGIGVLVLKEGKVLLGKRKGSHGDGEYAMPGGHLEYMESFEECARRETLEEAGIEIKNVSVHYLSNAKQYAPRHYVHIGCVAFWKSGEPLVLEPNKCESWGWYDLNDLPAPLFDLTARAIKAYQNNIAFEDM